MNLRFTGVSALAIMVAAGPALAQRTPLYQSGTTSPGDMLKAGPNGMATSAGDTGGDSNGRGVNPFGITEPAGGGIGLCTHSALTGGPHRSACIGHRADGKAVVEISSTDMPATGFVLNINGADIPVPGTVTGLPSVADTTALSTLPSSHAALIVRQDATVGRGGPAVMYRPGDAACTLNAGAGDGGSQIPASDGKCWLLVPASHLLDARIWDLDNTNGAAAAVANTTKLRAASAYGTATGRCILLPEGSMYISAEIATTTGKFCLRGSGRDKTFLFSTSTSGNIINLHGTMSGALISDMHLWGPGYDDVTAGAAIRVADSQNATTDIRNVFIVGTYNGVYIDDASVVKMDNLDIAHIRHSAWVLTGHGITGYGAQNVFLTNFSGFNDLNKRPSGACFEIAAVGEFHADGGACGGFVYGYRARPVVGQYVYNNYIQNVNFDVSENAGIDIDTSPDAGGVQGITFTNVTSGLGLIGASINGSNSKQITFNGVNLHRNTRTGMSIFGGRGIVVNGSQILSNSVGAPGYNSLEISGGTEIVINGNKFGGWRNEGNLNSPYNIGITDDFTGKVTIAANDLCESGTGGLFNDSTSVDVIIGRDNQCLDVNASGFLSEYGGTAVILSGQTSVTFNHNFPAVPGNVLVNGPDITHRFAATATATDITITADSAVAVDTAVYWRGWLKP